MMLLWRERLTFDVVHAHQLYSATILGMLAQWTLGYPLVVKVCNGGWLGDIDRVVRKGWSGRLRLWLLRRTASVCIAISREIADELCSVGIEPQQIREQPNLVDTDRFQPVDRARRAALRVALDLPADDRVVLFVGRFDRIKGLQHLVEAMADVPAHLVLVGDGEQRPAIEPQALRLLGSRARFVGWRGDIECWLQAADVLALSSVSEGQPTILLEAMACGLPVVATRVGAVDQMMSDGDSGKLVPPADPGALARALCEVLASPEMRRRMGQRGRALAIERFTVTAVAARYATMYDELRRTDACSVRPR